MLITLSSLKHRVSIPLRSWSHFVPHINYTKTNLTFINDRVMSMHKSHAYFFSKSFKWAKGKKILEFQGSHIYANFRDAIGRHSSAVHAPCLKHLAVSRMVAETWDPGNSNFFLAFSHKSSKLICDSSHFLITCIPIARGRSRCWRLASRTRLCGSSRPSTRVLTLLFPPKFGTRSKEGRQQCNWKKVKCEKKIIQVVLKVLYCDVLRAILVNTAPDLNLDSPELLKRFSEPIGLIG